MLLGWATAPTAEQLPEPRSQAATFTANGAMYVIGGLDASGTATDTFVWAVPDGSSGDIPAWHQLDQTHLPEARAGLGIAAIGTHVFAVGGEGADGAALSSVARANLCPSHPSSSWASWVRPSPRCPSRMRSGSSSATSMRWAWA